MDRYPISATEQEILESINIVFYCIFLVEMIIKMIGMGLKGYVRDKFNIFDAIIVILSSVDLALSLTEFNSQTQGNNSISAFRAFRLLRIFKLVKSWKKFQDLLITIIRSLKDISNFGILLCLFIFIYTLLGMELFAYQVKLDSTGDLTSSDDGNSPTSNFDKFYNAFVTVFTILTGEDWNNVYYTYARDNYVASTIFFYSLVIFGQLILLNLFLAILLDNFDEVEEEERKRKARIKAFEIRSKIGQALMFKALNILKHIKSQDPNIKKLLQDVTPSFMERIEKFDRSTHKQMEKIRRFEQRQQHQSDYFDNINDIEDSKQALNESEIHNDSHSVLRSDEEKSQIPHTSVDGSLKIHSLKFIKTRTDVARRNALSMQDLIKLRNSAILPSKTLLAHSVSVRRDQQSASIKALKPVQKKKTIKLSGRSLFVFGKDNKLRKFISRIIQNEIFDNIIIFLIIFASVILAIEDPLMDPDSKFNKVLYYMDTVLSSIFMFEALLKVITYGFLF